MARDKEWLLYRMTFKDETKYFVVTEIGQLTQRLCKIYGPKTKIEGMEIHLINGVGGSKEEVIVIGR